MILGKLDHMAYRVADRVKASKFLCDSLGFRIADDFEILFPSGEKAQAFALEPPERDLHEIFVSEGTPGSEVGLWVADRQGIGGLHHLAYAVDSVANTMAEWLSNGWAEFETEKPIEAAGLVQCFTKPHPLTGVVYELISRAPGAKGFNVDSVRALMESTGE